jgi:hypothetical protein
MGKLVAMIIVPALAVHELQPMLNRQLGVALPSGGEGFSRHALKAFEAFTTSDPSGGTPACITVRNTRGWVVIDD